MIDDVVAAATGRAHRADPVLATTGGPAGNARLTAWLGAAAWQAADHRYAPPRHQHSGQR